MSRRLVLLGLSLVLLLLVSAGVAAPSTVRIDPLVLQDTTQGQVGHFLVLLKPQADRRAVARPDLARVERRRAAATALRQTAETTQRPVRAQLDSLGARYRAYWIVNAIAVEGSRAVLDALAARADVALIEPDQVFHVDVDVTVGEPRAAMGIEWNISKVGAPELWTRGITGEGVVYANADTGVNWDHPALVTHYRGSNGGTINHNYNWWDAVHEDLSGNGSNPCNPDGFVALPSSGSLAPCDDSGHGTHTMGIGVGDDGAGNQIGVAPGAKWIACRNMEQNYGRPSTYLECFQFFLAPTDLNGANPDESKSPDVIGNSYVCPAAEGCASATLEEAMNNLRAAGIFMAVSAGNDGPSCGTIQDPPAIYDSAITVGATDSSDAIPWFSSRGPSTVGSNQLLKPDLVAPGYVVRSSVPGVPPNEYGTKYGTSMASPHIAGAVALLWSAFPELRGDVDMTESILKQTAVPVSAPSYCDGAQVPNNTFGYGRVDIYRAFRKALDLLSPFEYYFPIIAK